MTFSFGPAAVYFLCLATSTLCAGLLLRAFFASRSKLLLWTAMAFVFLSLNNLFVVGDLVVFPNIDLWPYRQATSVAAIAVLLYAFIWETER